MKTNKSIVIVILAAVILIGSGWMLFRFLPVHHETVESIGTWQEFCNMVSEGRIIEAEQIYIDFEDIKHHARMDGCLKFENDKVTYDGVDITEKLPRWKCKYRATFFDHYWKRSGGYKKVNFETGYALLKNGKIVYLKIP